MKAINRLTAAAIGAAVVSALLFHLGGTGLRPVPWLVWLAPLPVLVVAPRVGKRAAYAVAAGAWFGGESAMWRYYISTVQIPVPVAVMIVVGSALLFGLVVLLARALMLRRRSLLATVVFPAAWVAVELAMSMAAPFGAWWSLAYTQADVLPVLQIVSVTGVWGVTFLIMMVPAALAATTAPPLSREPRRWHWRPAIAATAALVIVLTYGFIRLSASHAPTADHVALIATDRDIDPTPIDSAAGRDLLNDYVSAVQKLATQTPPQANAVIVLPEKAFVADDTTLPTITTPLAQQARAQHSDIVVGLILDRASVQYNAAIDLPADGSPPVTYFKQHLLTGAEEDLTAGDTRAYLPGRQNQWALAICFDLDFPSLVRGYRIHDATTMFVPAWDFGDDAWLHSRMAVTRGVENGMSIVRAARQGALTVSDPYGRVSAESRTSGASVITVTAALPSSAGATLYTHLGDWFAWLCAALLLVGVAIASSDRRRDRAHRAVSYRS